MKINNAGNAQYLSFSVTTSFTETNIYNNGLTSLNAADHSTTVALATIQATATATSTSWWETTANQIATWQMYDQQTALLAFNANVGITDRTATDLPDTTKQLSLTGKRAIIPADGWSSGTTTTYAAIEYQMQSTASDNLDLDYSTPSYLWRTYSLTNGGSTYYAAVRAQIMAPEIFATIATFNAGLPFSAKSWATYTSGSAWTASKAVVADTDNTKLTASLLTAWADDATVVNKITASVNNGDSFVVALDHDVAVTWQTAAVAGLNQLELREQTKCTTFALSTVAAPALPCVPAFGFRIPVSAAAGSVWYAAFKAEVTGATSNLLAVGVYYVSIQATVTEPIRHYPTWASLVAARTDTISWRWTTTGMPSASFPSGNGGWTFQAAAPGAGW